MSFESLRCLCLSIIGIERDNQYSLCEQLAVPEQVHHGGGHYAVHVQDQVGLLPGGDGLHVERVPRDRPGGPARRHVRLQLPHSGVRVIY